MAVILEFLFNTTDYQGTTTLPVSEAIGCITRLGSDDGDIDLDDKGDYVSAAAHS